MAGYNNRNYTASNASFDQDEKDPLTLKGYIKLIESCESISDVLSCLKSHYGSADVDDWIAVLKNTNGLKEADHLFQYYNYVFREKSSKNRDFYKKLMETFSLLENVFRNVLLRPYIPAYRTINMNSGRYRCYIDSVAEELLKNLDFENLTDNLLTYTETNPINTIVYALTCSVLWNHLMKKLDACAQL